MNEHQFPTEAPIHVHARVNVADVDIRAGDRRTTSVAVVPRDPGSADDVEAAERVRVSYDGAGVRIEEPRRIRRSRGSFTVSVDAPDGSSADVATGVGDITVTGDMAELEARTGVGDADVERVTQCKVSSGAGSLAVRAAAGHATLRSGTGDLYVGNAHGGVTAKTGSGDIEIEAAHAGDFGLVTGTGHVSIGVPHGTSALLDVTSGLGRVESQLDTVEAPSDPERSITVRVRSGTGDIAIRRARTGTPVG